VYICCTEALASGKMFQLTLHVTMKVETWLQDCGSVTSDWLTTVANSQESHHALFKLDGMKITDIHSGKLAHK